MVIAIIALLVLALVAVLARYLLLKRQLRRWAAEMDRIAADDTNRRLRSETADKDAARLGTAINGLYGETHAARARQAEELRRVQRSMADISHDLRTPLTSINGYLGLMAKPGNTPAQQAEYLRTATAKGADMARLVDKLFEHTRLEAGDYLLQPRPLALNDAVGSALAAHYGLLEGAGIRPDVRLAGEPLQIVADAAGLERVFANLLGNCVQHGGGNLAVKSWRQGGFACVYFANYAPRLTQADVAQLFQRSYVPDAARTGAQSGLGLAIVKQFVTQMGGEVTAGLKDEMLRITLRWPLYA